MIRYGGISSFSRDFFCRRNLLRGCFIFVIFIFALYCGLKSEVYVDDVFITLKYARNIAEGKGMVFNAGEKSLGITSLLWCWLNAVGFVIFPAWRFGVMGCRILSIISVFGAAIGFYRLGRRMGWHFAGLIGAIGICLLQDHISLFGMEYPLCLWLALEIFLAFSHGRIKRLGILGGLIILTRPEAVILVVLVFLFEFAQSRSIKKLITMAGYVLIPLCPALLFSTLYFGSPIPNTLSAKRAQLENPYFFWAISVGLSTWRYFIVEFLRERTLAVYLFLVGLFWLFINLFFRRDFIKTRRGLVCALIFSWAIFHVMALHFLRIAFYRWYLYPVWFMIMFGITAGMRAIAIFVYKNRAVPKPVAAAIFMGVFLMIIVKWQSNWTNNINPWQKARFEGYKQIADKANDDFQGSEAQLLCPEVGVLGFYIKENIKLIDEFFLVRKIPERDDGRFPNRMELVFQYRPKYMVDSHPWFQGISEDQQEFQNKRLEEDFREKFTSQTGECITYIPVLKIKSEFGIQVLYRMEQTSGSE